MLADHIASVEIMSLKIEKYYKMGSDGSLDLFWVLKLGGCDYFDFIGSGNELMDVIAEDITKMVNEDREVEIYVTAEKDMTVIYGVTPIFVSEISDNMDIPYALNYVENMGFTTKEE